MTKNYVVSSTGFTVTDFETKHILEVFYQNDAYHAVVLMPDQGERLSLTPWK